MPEASKTENGPFGNQSCAPTKTMTAAVMLLLLAAWTAAGSVGLLAHSLRHACTWLLLVFAASVAWPRERRAPGGMLLFAAAALAGLGLTWAQDVSVNALAVAVFAAGLAVLQTQPMNRSLLMVSAGATGIFALYRLLLVSFPTLWQFADCTAVHMASAAGWAAGRPLSLGPTFGGIDFLVLAAAWYAIGGRKIRPSSAAREIGLILLVLFAAHALYLIVISFAGDGVAWLPKADPKTPDSNWIAFLRCVLPWNMPLAGAAFHLVMIALFIRWNVWRPESGAAETGQRTALRWSWPVVAAVLAGCIAALASVCLGPARMDGKKVVIFEEGYLNWMKPKHGDYGRLSIGMYGLLPHFVRSLGASCLVSPGLSEEDLRGADVLMLIYPDKPWEPQMMRRIWKFVRDGGSLWVLADHTLRDHDGGSCVNDVLAPSTVRAQFDCAEFAVGGWLQSYETIAHPSTLGLSDERNQIGIVIGASLGVRPPARPIVIGRWGWSDWGDEGRNAMMGNGRYDAGERLGDVILAAEQQVGLGRVVVFGDTSSLSNGINMGSHEFTSRLLGYLANRVDTPQARWRFPLAFLLAVALVLTIGRSPSPALALCASALAVAACRVAATAWVYHSTEIVPQSRHPRGHGLAYIDASHQGLYSAESWRDDGLMGIAMAFMRDDYLTLTLHDFTASRLQQADILLTVAPSRRFTKAEREAVRQFVEKGGIFVLTAGYDQRACSEDLLAEFGLGIGDGSKAAGGDTGPKPFGFFKSPYFSAGDYMSHVRFYSAWPVFATAPDAQILAYGPGNVPAILMRRVGKGKVMLVGDSCFAMNRNLEVESGMAFEGMRENPNFWRWVLRRLEDKPMWIPPKEVRAGAPAAGTGSEGSP